MSGLFWVYMENISGQAVSFIVTIILARLLEPDDYGSIALIGVFVALAQVFITGGISSALIQKKDSDELDYSTMFWFNLCVSVLLYIFLFVLAPAIANYYDNMVLSPVLRIMALSIPLSAFNCIQQAYVASNMVFRKSFLSNFGGVIVSGIVGIVMAYFGLGLWALVAQRLLYVAVNTVLLKIVIDWYPKLMFSMERLKPLLSFGWKLMVTGFMFTGYSELRSLIIGKRYSSTDLGYYDRGFSFPKLIAGNVDSTITRVLFPALAKEQDSKANLADKTRRAAKMSAYIMTPILWGLAGIAHPLVLLLLGEKWLPCVPYLQIMCFIWWLQPTQSCSAQAIKAIGRSDLYLYLEITCKTVGLGLLAYAVLVLDSVIAITIMYLVSQIVSVILYGWVTSKTIGYKIRHQLIDLLYPAVMSLLMCGLALLLETVINSVLMCVLLQIVICSISYLLFSLIIRYEPFIYICSILRDKKQVH